MLLTAEEARQFVETSLDDASFDVLLAAAEEAIIEAVGPLSYDETPEAEERHRPHGDLLLLYRRAAVITSVVEGTTTLATDDYALRQSGMTLRRLPDGTNPSSYWCGPVTVTYSPYSDLNSRKRAQAQLVQLYVATRPGITSQTIGPWSEVYGQMSNLLSSQQDILASIRSTFDGIR